MREQINNALKKNTKTSLNGEGGRQVWVEGGDEIAIRLLGRDAQGRWVLGFEFEVPIPIAQAMVPALEEWLEEGTVVSPPDKMGIHIVESRRAVVLQRTPTLAEAVQQACSEYYMLEGLQARERTLRNLRLRHASLAEADLERANLVDAQFYIVEFRETNLARSWLHRAQFEACMFRSTSFEGIKAENNDEDQTEFLHCMFWGVKFTEAHLRNVVFNRCTFVSCKFWNATCLNVEFHKCGFHDVDDDGALWEDVTIEDHDGLLPIELEAAVYLKDKNDE